MKIVCFLLLSVALLMGASGPARAASAEEDLAKLQGTWVTISLENEGKTLVDEKTPPKEGPATKLVQEGNRWMIKVGDKIVASGTIKLDPAKTPKEIDVMDEAGPSGKTHLGIYEIAGDLYKYCLAQPGKPRPTEFATSEGSGRSLGVSRREKP
ncbi:MAG TPA: TIGR03067 domain-containing protein [Thermoanaerobaculia bacterium]|nr:TIGR03067 domain-containing protein [Thermoanaerobaculia bacterium]